MVVSQAVLERGCRRGRMAADRRGVTGKPNVAETFDKGTFVHLMFRCVNVYDIDFARLISSVEDS
jgi:hypothetical protein